MTFKTVYSYNPETFEYIGEVNARRDPLEREERYLIPAHATEIKPATKEGKVTKWSGSNWILQDIPLPPEAIKLTLEEVKSLKKLEAKSLCEVFRTSPLIVEDKTYKATDTAKLKFWSLLNETKLYPITWLQSDDISFSSLTKVQAIALSDAFKDQDLSAYKQRGDFLSKIDSCKTLKEVSAINLTYK